MKKNAPEREVLQTAAYKNAVANNLLNRGKYRDALDSLNQAIQLSPSYPHSYVTRAKVFERMGMLPQAEADRAKASSLTIDGGYDEDEVFGTAAAPPLAAVRLPRPRRTRSMPRLVFPAGFIAPVILFSLLIVGTGGAFLGATALLRDTSIEAPNIFDGIGFTASNGTSTPTPQPSDAAAQTATPPPTPIPPAATTGSPFSFTTLEAAWRTKGITPQLGTSSPGFNGFTINPIDATLSGPGSAQMSIFFYDKRDGPKADWDLAAGQRPSPKSGRSVPSHTSIWWNGNVIIVVRSLTGEMNKPAFDAFIALGS